SRRVALTYAHTFANESERQSRTHLAPRQRYLMHTSPMLSFSARSKRDRESSTAEDSQNLHRCRRPHMGPRVEAPPRPRMTTVGAATPEQAKVEMCAYLGATTGRGVRAPFRGDIAGKDVWIS